MGSEGAPKSCDPVEVDGYRIVRRLAQGGQGVVYLARNAQDEPVALKLLLPKWLEDPTARERLAKEIDAARTVARFCVAQVLDAKIDGDLPYIVSEYIEGSSLYQRVKKHGPLQGAALDRLAVATATAVAAIHRAQIVHRDLKPSNVMLGPDGPRVIDFGIARDLSLDVTTTGRIVGSPNYMAPEQLAGAPVGAPADVFSWACTVVFAATGRTPFSGDALAALAYQVVHADPDTDGVPGALRTLVGRCLAKDPDARPTAEQLLLALLGGPGMPPVAPAAAPDAADPAPPTATPTVLLAASPTVPLSAASPAGRSGRRPLGALVAVGMALIVVGVGVAPAALGLLPGDLSIGSGPSSRPPMAADLAPAAPTSAPADPAPAPPSTVPPATGTGPASASPSPPSTPGPSPGPTPAPSPAPSPAPTPAPPRRPTPEPTPTPTPIDTGVPSEFAGVWTGTARQTDGAVTPFDVTMRLGRGADQGTIGSSTLSCTGVVDVVGMPTAGVLQLRQRATGSAGPCALGADITMTKRSPDRAAWAWVQRSRPTNGAAAVLGRG